MLNDIQKEVPVFTRDIDQGRDDISGRLVHRSRFFVLVVPVVEPIPNGGVRLPRFRRYIRGKPALIIQHRGVGMLVLKGDNPLEAVIVSGGIAVEVVRGHAKT